EDGVCALDYLLFCWSQKVHDDVTSDCAIPKYVLDEARRRAEDRRERIDLDGRVLHRWGGRNLAADTSDLAEAIINAGPKLFRIDKALVRIAKPITDPITAQRVRDLYNYKGEAGVAGDPALHAGERPVPILPGDSEALRALIAKHIATRLALNTGTKSKPVWTRYLASFAFK